jgi:hypothetical protein
MKWSWRPGMVASIAGGLCQAASLAAGLGLTAGPAPAAEQERPFPVLHGPYLGQRYPGFRPKAFGWGIISSEQMETGGAVTPDGGEFFFTRRADFDSLDDRLMVTREEAAGWTQPAPPAFAQQCREGEATISPDGTILYFTSTRPRVPGSAPQGAIWEVRRLDTVWGQPHLLGPGVNQHSATSISSTWTGRLYFDGRIEGRAGICRSVPVEGKYETAVLLPESINRLKPSHPFVVADESCLFFDAGPPDSCALYVALRRPDDSWSEPEKLGPEINSTGTESRPRLSPDGRYFFFTRAARRNLDIYWASARVLGKWLDRG